MFRKAILNIHIYCGLLCFSFLLIFGVSTLIFNHPFAFTRKPASVETWTQPLTLPPLTRTDGDRLNDKVQMVRQNNGAILKALGSFALPPSAADGGWTDPDTYHAHFARPGKEYQIDAHPSRNSATITQSRMSFWMICAALHSDSYTVFSTSWKWYVELGTIGVINAGLTGIFLWPARARERRIGIITLAVSGAISISLMLYLSLHG